MTVWTQNVESMVENHIPIAISESYIGIIVASLKLTGQPPKIGHPKGNSSSNHPLSGANW